MERPGPKTKLVRFGLFEADLNGRSLNKDGLRIRIQEQPFQILVLLLERPGEVVTRESIRQQLWPADTYVAFDDGLNTAMKKLRLALGDSSDNPRFIETIPRRGYRFLASPVFVDASPKRTPVLSDIDAIAREPRLANTTESRLNRLPRKR
jgi:DNA-binding winged helix-turn-helix (wHTH) protein